MQKVRFAVVGCGGFGEHLSKVLNKLPEAHIVATCDLDEQRARELGQVFDAAIYTETSRLYREAEFEAVLVVTQNDKHCENTVEAVEAGKHVFCEKPMARNLAECVRMAQAARKQGVCLMVGHKRRLRPTHLYMSELIARGRLGNPTAILVDAVWGQEQIGGWWAHASRSGGMLSWNGVHDLDFMRCICGDVARVRALQSLKTHKQHDYPDMVFVEMQFASGAIGSFRGAFYFPLVSERESSSVRIVCERGGIAYEGAQISVRYSDHGGELETKEFPEYGFESAYRMELSSFIRWITNNESPVVSWEDGLKCVEIMEAAYLSLNTGNWVDLPLPERAEFGC